MTPAVIALTGCAVTTITAVTCAVLGGRRAARRIQDTEDPR